MGVFIHLGGQEEAFSLQLLPMNQLAATLTILFLQDFKDVASMIPQVSDHSETSESLFPASSLSPGIKKLHLCTFVTYLLQVSAYNSLVPVLRLWSSTVSHFSYTPVAFCI